MENKYPITIEGEADFVLLHMYLPEIITDKYGGAFPFGELYSCVSMEDRYNKKDYEQNIDRMHKFSLTEYDVVTRKLLNRKIDKEIVRQLRDNKYITVSGGGSSVMEKNPVYDISWCLTAKGRKYCKEKGFDKLVR